MDGITAFFRNILRSCYDLEFYREVRTAPARKSFWYLASLVALFTLLGVVQFVPAALRGRDHVAETLRTRVPDGAILEMKDNALSTNLPMPFALGEDGSSVVLDTSVAGEEARDVPDGTLIIGRDALFFDDATGNRVAPYADIESFRITKEDAVNTVARFPSGLLAFLVMLLALPVYLGLMIGALLYVLLAASIAFAVTQVAKVPLRFGQWFAVCCRAATLPIVATALFGPWLARVPFGRVALMLMIVLAVVADERANPTSGSVLDETQGPPAPEDKVA